MKSLRAKKAQDIIFSGSDKKSRLSYASVSLLFDNHDQKIPLEFKEVSITRKLFRDGESEYLINGSHVRLIDVIDLLAKAGIGKDSYSVVNQGMTDAILSATALQRRSVLEDAAGVKQHKIKKERALKKMETAKNNLEQTRSLMKEIEPHLKMLKRQAEKAQKGKIVADQLREKQIKLFAYLWHNFEKEKKISATEKEETGRLMMNAQRELDIVSDALNEESRKTGDFSERKKLENDRARAYDNLNRVERELVLAEGKMEILKEKLFARQAIQTEPVDLNYIQMELKKIHQHQEELITRLEKAEKMEELQDIKEFSRAVQLELYELYENTRRGKRKIGKSPEQNQEENELKKEIENFSQVKKDQEKQREKLRALIENLENKIKEEIEKERRAREKFFQLEKEFQKKQRESNILKDRFNEAKVRLAKVEVREEDLTGEIKEALGLSPRDLVYDNQPIEREKLEREINRLKLEKEQIGAIDPLVLEEYQETSDRFNFLNQESEDLEKAIISLRQIAKEMDIEIKKVFEKAFQKINYEFEHYFKMIFGGGKAELVKVKLGNEESENKENEDPEEEAEKETREKKQEDGIEIYVCPPGKKISNLSILSGGERSLVSIAFLFAMIAYNPPPFVFLDEVEAALDEANSRRLGKILRELSGNTQFIAITHNREIMRQAALLYGVTMGGDGVSKVFSVKLDQVGTKGEIKK